MYNFNPISRVTVLLFGRTLTSNFKFEQKQKDNKDHIKAACALVRQAHALFARKKKQKNTHTFHLSLVSS